MRKGKQALWTAHTRFFFTQASHVAPTPLRLSRIITRLCTFNAWKQVLLTSVPMFHQHSVLQKRIRRQLSLNSVAACSLSVLSQLQSICVGESSRRTKRKLRTSIYEPYASGYYTKAALIWGLGAAMVEVPRCPTHKQRGCLQLFLFCSRFAFSSLQLWLSTRIDVLE